MRNLSTILEDAKHNKPVTAQEAYYSMLVLAGLLNMAEMDIRKMAHDPKVTELFRKIYANENHRRYQVALISDPVHYLGDHVPSNADYQAWLRVGERLFAQVMAQHNDPAPLYEIAEDPFQDCINDHEWCWSVLRIETGESVCDGMSEERAAAVCKLFNETQAVIP